MSRYPLDFDYLVLGAGINGTFAALHLSEKGHRTALVEQFPLPHSRGSSHGQSRIIRRAYSQPFLRAMMDDAYAQWGRLEREAGVQLIRPVGMLVRRRRRRKKRRNSKLTKTTHKDQFVIAVTVVL